jgi:cell division septum initiation protein DivIVA
MPDQSSASTEHALMQEITAPLATLPDDLVPAVADVAFSTSLRGYDRLAVDAYVQKTSQLVAELQATRSPDAAIRRALERVGEEVSGILQRAHDTAGEITAQSRSEAEDRLETARREAAAIVLRAQERVNELDAETDRIWAERHRIVEDTRGLARELLELTGNAADRFPPVEASAGASQPLFNGQAALGDEEEELADELEQTARMDEVDEAAPGEDELWADELGEDEPGASAGEAEPGEGDPGEGDPGEGDPDIESTAILPTLERDDEPDAQ